jgi:hypothetical protein
MLPDIDTPNRRFAVSGLGAHEGSGVLSRSFEDLHPQPDHYDVVWNGSIEAQIQKAEQRPAPTRDTSDDVPGLMCDRVLDLFHASSGPLSGRDVATRMHLTPQTADWWLRNLSRSGRLVCALLPNPRAGEQSQPRFLRMYAVAKTKEQAA